MIRVSYLFTSNLVTFCYQIVKQLQYAQDLFYRPSISYDTFKQRCESFRIFLFFGISGILTLDLLIRPPRSSYWKCWNPINLSKSLIRQFFSYNSYSVFYNDSHHSTEGWDIYQKTIESTKGNKPIFTPAADDAA